MSRNAVIVSILLRLTLTLSLNHDNSELAKILHRPIRGLSYPDFSTMGLFFAVAVPLEEPAKSISLSYFFEASYGLPVNETYYGIESRQATRKKRGLDRATVYQALENKFESSGYPGRECLLRTICETSEHPLRHNGVIGDMLHVIFTPSSSQEETLPEEFAEAEFHGRNGTCARYHSDCPKGLLDLIGIFA